MEERRSPSGKVVSVSGTISNLDPGNIASGSVLESTASFPGAKVGDVVTASPTGAIGGGVGVMYSYARVTTTDVVAIAIANMSTGAIHPANVSYDVECRRL